MRVELKVGNVADVDMVSLFVRRYGRAMLETLLKDHTTGRNIVWADDEYMQLGEGYAPHDEITFEKIADRHFGTIEPRVAKAAAKQAWRTRSHAEVFTPSWLCERMVDGLDDAFFGEELGLESAPGLTPERMAALGEGGLWQHYIDNRLLEITCGEAPFICSPYDAATGEVVPVAARAGFLDRKLRAASALAEGFDEWLAWAYRALEACYGYEYQGDNLLIARINVAMTFAEHMEHRWGRHPSEQQMRRAARIVAWNLWQMDGLTGCAPCARTGKPPHEEPQMALFKLEPADKEQAALPLYDVPCKIYDWRARKPQAFNSLKGWNA